MTDEHDIDLTPERQKEIEANVLFHCADVREVLIGNRHDEFYEIRYAAEWGFELVQCHSQIDMAHLDIPQDYEDTIGHFPSIEEAALHVALFGGES